MTTIFLATAVLTMIPVPALADPAGPTDYVSDIVAIEPRVEGISVRMIGGDSFIELVAVPGTRVEVVGYQGEPYLRFLPSGAVEVNDNSPTTYLNEDRYADSDVPATASARSDPAWRQVEEGGSYAWHDHRSHWMNPARPLGREPGDQILEAVIPVVVDGVAVELTVISVWQPAPSPLPVVAGAILGAGGVSAVMRRRSAWLSLLLLGGVAALATAAGLMAWAPLPSEARPGWWLWAAPITSLVLAAHAGWVARRRDPSLVLPAVAAVELTVWAGLRWPWMVRAVLPTEMPFPIDRGINALALVVGAGLSVWYVARVVGGRPPSGTRSRA
jgi:hypothetical protein